VSALSFSRVAGDRYFRKLIVSKEKPRQYQGKENNEQRQDLECSIYTGVFYHIQFHLHFLCFDHLFNITGMFLRFANVGHILLSYLKILRFLYLLLEDNAEENCRSACENNCRNGEANPPVAAVALIKFEGRQWEINA
jgi:hypothetical protein